MDLALSLGETSKAPLTWLNKTQQMKTVEKEIGFCMGLGPHHINGGSRSLIGEEEEEEKSGSSDPPVQLDLLPFTPVQQHHQPTSHLPFPWLNANYRPGRELEVNRRSLAAEEGEDGAVLSSPNSTVSSSLQMDYFSIYNISGRGCKRDSERDEQRGVSSRASDEEDNGLNRKKLRLSKDQSAFLEDSFKEHPTLNPKQKQALAKQLNLRPRQVEVWFQNRRARTKLKQTEVDCEYLKRWCETLTEDNRRLNKELQELRALKSSQPFYKQLPPTTLTMCPSCERVASTITATGTTAAAKPRSSPFTISQSQAQAQVKTQQAGSGD